MKNNPLAIIFLGVGVVLINLSVTGRGADVYKALVGAGGGGGDDKGDKPTEEDNNPDKGSGGGGGGFGDEDMRQRDPRDVIARNLGATGGAGPTMNLGFRSRDAIVAHELNRDPSHTHRDESVSVNPAGGYRVVPGASAPPPVGGWY